MGAGGIGFFLLDRIRIMNWEEASFIMLMVLLTVYAIDAFSKRIRMHIIKP